MEASEKHFFQLFAEYEYKLDSQRRIAVPAPWRMENPGGKFMVIRAKGNVLQMYPEQAFVDRFAEKLWKRNPGDPKQMQAIRDFCSNIVTCICDGQGRIQLPKELLEKAGIVSRVAMIGTGNFAQLMSAEQRAAEREEAKRSGGEDDYLDILDMPEG